MTEHRMDEREIQHLLHDRVMAIIEKLSLEMYPDRKKENFRFYWQEAFSNGNNFERGGVVHSWMSSYVISEAIRRKTFVIRSQGWYLDLNQPGGSYENFVDSWQGFFGVDPADNVKEDDRKKYVLGGGGCQWGEKVNNGNIDEQIWPRSLAISEVLWAYRNRGSAKDAKPRLEALSCKLRQVGVESGAIMPGRPCEGRDEGHAEPIPGWTE